MHFSILQSADPSFQIWGQICNGSARADVRPLLEGLGYQLNYLRHPDGRERIYPYRDN